jgi:hypothetical protein
VLIADICGRVEAAFARNGWPLAERPVVGTLTTGQVSATTRKGATGAPMILIDNGFFRLASMISQLAVFATYDAEIKGGFSNPTLQLLSDLVATQTVMNTCLYTYKRATPPQYEPVVAALRDAIGVFLISHEYAHISAGDLDAHPAGGGRHGGDLHSREFEADRVGFITAVEAAQDPDYGAFGPFLYFAALDLVARAEAAYHGRPAPSTDTPASEYPTPFERTVNLMERLEPTPYWARFEHQIGRATKSYNTILFVWDEILPAFWAVRQELAAFDPRRPGPMRWPDADTFGVVTTLWQAVLAHRGRN